jgi:muramidase (phage lysozyme)
MAKELRYGIDPATVATTASQWAKDYTYQLETSLNQLKSAGVGLFNKFKDGQEGASVYNDSMRAGADLLATFLKALGPLGVILGLVVKAGAEYVAAANEQSDALFDGYTKLTKFGAGFDTGLDGVYRVNQQLGYSTREIEKFVGILSKNQQVFPMFRGTVTRGVTAYGDLVDRLREFETEFRVLGLSVDDVNHSVANYLQVQTMIGMSQRQDLDQLSRGAYNYIQQQMLVSRLTGQNADAQRATEEQMANNAVFQVVQRELRLKYQAAMAAEDTAEAARIQSQMNENRKLILMAPVDVQKGLMDAMGGFVGASEDAQRSLLLMPEATRMAMSQRHQGVDVLDVGSKEARERLNQFSNTLAALGEFDGVFGSYVGAREMDLLTTRQSLAARAEEAQTQIDERKRVKDSTAAFAATVVEQRRTRESFEDAINLGMNSATAAMRGLTAAANAAAQATGRVAGTPTPRSSTGGPPTPAAGTPAAGTPAAVSESQAPKGSTQALLDLIGRVESRSNYNVLVGGRAEPQLTNMTVAEVLEYQQGMRSRGHESTAVGKYQIIRSTLGDLVKTGAVSLDEQFSPATQDRLAIALLNRRGYQRYLQGALTVHEFADSVAMEWASFPMPNGRSFYAGVGSNKALVDRSTVVSTLQGYRFGGVAEGPDSGYVVELHGTEAVVPLPNGRSIPVDMPDFSAGVRAQRDAIAEQNSRLDDLITIMRTRNQISEKILRAYQS